jgi:hypothetical protein
MKPSRDTFNTCTTLTLTGAPYSIYSLRRLVQAGFDVERLPYSLKILLENLLRCENDQSVRPADIEALCRWQPHVTPEREIAFMPARVILQDFTGVPAVVDLAAMRDALTDLGGDPRKINPHLASELVIDHSVQVDVFGSPDAASSSAIASATPFCVGAKRRSTTSVWCRRAPASFTRSIWSTSHASSSRSKRPTACSPIPTRSSARTATRR